MKFFDVLPIGLGMLFGWALGQRHLALQPVTYPLAKPSRHRQYCPEELTGEITVDPEA